MTAAPATAWVPEWSLADRLRRIRREMRMSQDEFADLLRVKPSRYGAWETGRNHPDRLVDLARRVEEVTGVPASWTLGVYRPDDGGTGVRHQGLEPRTRWFGRSGERRGFMPVVCPGGKPHRRRRVVLPLAVTATAEQRAA